MLTHLSPPKKKKQKKQHTHTHNTQTLRWLYEITRLYHILLVAWCLFWWFASKERVWSYMTLYVLTETRCDKTTQTLFVGANRGPSLIYLFCHSSHCYSYTPMQWGNYYHRISGNPTAAVNLFLVGIWRSAKPKPLLHVTWLAGKSFPTSKALIDLHVTHFALVVFRSDEKIDYGIVWELQTDDRSLNPHDRFLLISIKILIHLK